VEITAENAARRFPSQPLSQAQEQLARGASGEWANGRSRQLAPTM